LKVLTRYFFILLLFLCSVPNYGQENGIKGYWIDGDEVVFSFDADDFNKASKDDSGDLIDFKDLNIKKVVVSGNFNGWSKDEWLMKPVGSGKYELRKKISKFTDEFLWEFKFVINNSYWAEPESDFSNATPAADPYGKNYYTAYNLKLFTAIPDKNGNTSFILPGYHNAKDVVLSGTFNRWDLHYFKMNHTERGWELNLNLKPGIYEYKFIVDGDWMEDPNNTAKIPNEFNGYNSLKNIQKQVTFSLNGYQTAQEVILTGSFDNWDEHKIKMNKKDGAWVRRLKLSAGKYHYKFIVDGEWLVDPVNSVMEYDENGNINSVYIVK